MQIVYNGPHPEVVVDELDSTQVIVAGQPVDITDDLAARLLEQSTWALSETPAQKAARDKQDAADAKAAADAQAAAQASPSGVTVEVSPEPTADTTTKGNS